MVRIGNRFNLKLPKLVSLILLCFVMLFTGCSNDTNTSNVTIIMNKKGNYISSRSRTKFKSNY